MHLDGGEALLRVVVDQALHPIFAQGFGERTALLQTHDAAQVTVGKGLIAAKAHRVHHHLAGQANLDRHPVRLRLRFDRNAGE